MDKVWWKQARLAAAAMKKELKRGYVCKDKVTLFAYAHNKTVGVSPTQYCHAGLSSVDKGCIAIVNSVQTYQDKYLKPEEKELLMHWLANESPFKEVFVSKSAKQILKQGYAFMRTDLRADLVGAACVAMRFLWEKSHHTVAWIDLVAGGMDKSLAFYLCHWINHGGTRGGTADLARYTGNHQVFEQMSAKGVKNFLTNSPTGGKPDYKDSTNYRGYGRALYDLGWNGSFMVRVCKLYDPKLEKNKAKTNPFKQVEEDGAPYQACIDELVRLKDVLMEEVMNA